MFFSPTTYCAKGRGLGISLIPFKCLGLGTPAGSPALQFRSHTVYPRSPHSQIKGSFPIPDSSPKFWARDNSHWSAIKKQTKYTSSSGSLICYNSSKNSGTLATDICKLIMKDTRQEWPSGLETQDKHTSGASRHTTMLASTNSEVIQTPWFRSLYGGSIIIQQKDWLNILPLAIGS